MNTNKFSFSSSNCGEQTAALAINGTPSGGDVEVEEHNGTSWTEIADTSTSRADPGVAGTTTLALVFNGNTAPGTKTVNTEFWNGSSWTEVGNTSTATQDLGSGGTTVAALGFGGQPGFQTITEEWDAGQNVEIITD